MDFMLEMNGFILKMMTLQKQKQSQLATMKAKAATEETRKKCLVRLFLLKIYIMIYMMHVIPKDDGYPIK